MPFGIAVAGAKSYDMSVSRPLTWIGSLSIGASIGNVNNSSGDFSAKCPAGSQLVAIPDNVVAILKTSISAVMQFKSLAISVDNNARTVTATLDLTTNLQSPSFASSAADRPKLVNVYCVYPGEINQGGFGFAVAAGGSFPYVVDSNSGLFLTYLYNGAFTGNLTLPVGANSTVFCYWDDPNVGLIYDEVSRTLKGYVSGNNQSGINLAIKICVFTIKTPEVPAWGIAVRGIDGGISFTSAETPMMYRGNINTPSANGSATAFSTTDQAQQPMVPVMKIGGQLASTNWFHLGMARSGTSFFGRPTSLINGGDSTNPNQQVVGYASKPLPFLWATDYF